MIKASEALSQLTSKIDQIKDDSIRRKLMERIKQAESIPDDQWKEEIDGVGKWLSFTIKNGENLLFLTDKPKFAHPLQKFMTRRPDRYLSDRAYKNHFRVSPKKDIIKN
jgi:hypothetical protein